MWGCRGYAHRAKREAVEIFQLHDELHIFGQTNWRAAADAHTQYVRGEQGRDQDQAKRTDVPQCVHTLHCSHA